METTYLICAAIGGTLIVCQFVLTLFGLGGDHDMGGHDGDVGGGHGDMGGHDSAGDHHGGDGHDSTWFMGVLTFRTLSAATAFFGLTGIIGQRAELEPFVTLLLALAAGGAALFLVSWIMRLMVRMNIDGTVRIDHAIGCRGTVYITIPSAHAGQGKVQVSVHNRTMEYKAVTALGPLAPGVKIVVVRVAAPDTVEVSSTSE
jgi:uncharacterized protein (DUF2126 family)